VRVQNEAGDRFKFRILYTRIRKEAIREVLTVDEIGIQSGILGEFAVNAPRVERTAKFPGNTGGFILEFPKTIVVTEDRRTPRFTGGVGGFDINQFREVHRLIAIGDELGAEEIGGFEAQETAVCAVIDRFGSDPHVSYHSGIQIFLITVLVTAIGRKATACIFTAYVGGTGVRISERTTCLVYVRNLNPLTGEREALRNQEAEAGGAKPEVSINEVGVIVTEVAIRFQPLLKMFGVGEV
jgi:hypothetical protein